MFSEVGSLGWTDEQFLCFCKEYVNLAFNRRKYNEENDQWTDVQGECVAAINLYLKECGYELREAERYGDKIAYDIAELEDVKGRRQGIVFAAVGKPDILLTDVLNCEVMIPEPK